MRLACGVDSVTAGRADPATCLLAPAPYAHLRHQTTAAAYDMDNSGAWVDTHQPFWKALTKLLVLFCCSDIVTYATFWCAKNANALAFPRRHGPPVQR